MYGVSLTNSPDPLKATLRTQRPLDQLAKGRKSVPFGDVATLLVSDLCFRLCLAVVSCVVARRRSVFFGMIKRLQYEEGSLG